MPPSVAFILLNNAATRPRRAKARALGLRARLTRLLAPARPSAPAHP
jgi:hypothetical protein